MPDPRLVSATSSALTLSPSPALAKARQLKIQQAGLCAGAAGSLPPGMRGLEKNIM